MIEKNQRHLNTLRVALDLLVLIGSYILVYFLFFQVIPPDTIFGGRIAPPDVTETDYQLASLYIIPLHLILYALFGLYRNLRMTGRRTEAVKILIADFLAAGLVIMAFFLFVNPYRNNFSSMFLFEIGAMNTILIVLERNLLRFAIRASRKTGKNVKHILVAGYSESAKGFIQRVKLNPSWEYQILGVLDDSMTEIEGEENTPVLGKLSALPTILSGNEVDEVFVTLPFQDYQKLGPVINACEKAGVMVKLIPDYGPLIPSKPYTEDLQGLPVIHVRRVPLNDSANAFLKRSLDILGSLFAIILFSPIMLVTALLVKTTKGPVIYKQERVGLHNRNFMMYKFRSMVVQDAKDEKNEWTKKGDARVTPVGKFIRKTSIDELPQLFNVLSGKMSLIGPRPERPQFVQKFEEEIPRYRVKHQVRPGMTGWAQVNGLRGDTSIEERIRYDIYYIENWTFWFDIKILFLTFFKGFVNKNAY